MKKRLDQLLVERKLAKSRQLAQRLILAGEVFVNGQLVTKVGFLIPEDVEIEVKKKFPYVSRGAKKIEAAAKEFKIDFKNKAVCDVGASTGGFTDFALQHGAKKVYAIDVGYGQLDQKLRKNSKVVVMERTNIKDVKSLPEPINIFLIDVSFISLKQVLPVVKIITQSSKPRAQSQIIALIKPQFEVGKKEADRYKGIIKNSKLHKKVVDDIKNWCKENGFCVLGLIESPILGAKGNKEFLLWLVLK